MNRARRSRQSAQLEQIARGANVFLIAHWLGRDDKKAGANPVGTTTPPVHKDPKNFLVTPGRSARRAGRECRGRRGGSDGLQIELAIRLRGLAALRHVRPPTPRPAQNPHGENRERQSVA